MSMIGKRVRIADRAFSINGLDIPANRVFEVVQGDDYYIGCQVATRGGRFGGGVYAFTPDQYEVVNDPSEITDLNEFRRLVAEETLKAKRANNWCGEAEETLKIVGLGEFLPVIERVKMEYVIYVERQPGESDTSVRRRARAGLTYAEGVDGYRNTDPEIMPRED